MWHENANTSQTFCDLSVLIIAETLEALPTPMPGNGAHSTSAQVFDQLYTRYASSYVSSHMCMQPYECDGWPTDAILCVCERLPFRVGGRPLLTHLHLQLRPAGRI